MKQQFEVRQMASPDGPVAGLIDQANASGFRFMETLRREWHAGNNRFDRPGEIYLEVLLDGRIVAAGGLNIDPYAGRSDIARIRHVYVLEEARRSGAGRLLLEQLIERARQNFRRLRLRTNTLEGGAFYAAIGFETSSEDAATQVMEL